MSIATTTLQAALRQGVELTRRELLTLLERYSLSPVSPPAKAGIFEVADGSEPSDRPDVSERPGDNDRSLPVYWPG